ncbi:MATE family efflux transporter [Oscillospiraceae bacterium NTUH-002-81]|nr:MATE family efflux transporter [Oscillospiraceae bacterium NTUH-002-81]
MLTETRGFASVAERNAFYKKAASLILPMALQNLINVGVTATDIILLGKVGETVLSGASLAGQIQFIMTLIFFGVTSGASVLIAQYWGKKDVDAIEKVMGIALKIAVVTGALFTAAALFFSGYLMRIYTAEPAVIAEGVKYLRIVGISYLFNAVSMVYLNLIRSVERVIISTVVYALSLALNFIIDVILIFGYLGFAPMGVKGAAIGTLIARILEFVIMVIYAVWMNDTVKIRLRYCLHMDPVLLGDFFKYALPVTFNEMAWGVAFSMNAAIIGHLGSAAVAANSVAQVVRQLAMVISFGVSSAAAIMVGKAIGEADSASAVLYAEKLRTVSVVCGVVGAGLVLLLRPFVISQMTLSALAADYLYHMIGVMAVYLMLQSHNTLVIVGVLRGGGDTRYGLLVDALSMWCYSIPLGFIGAFVLKLDTKIVYMMLMSDELLKLPFCIARFRSRKWVRDVTR